MTATVNDRMNHGGQVNYSPMWDIHLVDRNSIVIFSASKCDLPAPAPALTEPTVETLLRPRSGRQQLHGLRMGSILAFTGRVDRSIDARSRIGNFEK